jgi:hypothetical protein
LVDPGQVAILVSSFDGYRDAWDPFFTLFFRYWPDCPFTIYLISNNARYDGERVINLALGDDMGWANNMIAALSRIQAPYVIYLQEDYFLTRPVSTQRIIELIEYMDAKQAGYLRLYPSPGPDLDCADNPDIGEISKKAPYRVSMQAAVWRKDILQSLLVKDEDGWDMEFNGSERSLELDAVFLSVHRNGSVVRDDDLPLPYLCTAIIRGSWIREALEYCRAEGIELDTSRVTIEPYSRYLIRKFEPIFWKLRMIRLSFWIRKTLHRLKK